MTNQLQILAFESVCIWRKADLAPRRPDDHQFARREAGPGVCQSLAVGYRHKPLCDREELLKIVHRSNPAGRGRGNTVVLTFIAWASP